MSNWDANYEPEYEDEEEEGMYMSHMNCCGLRELDGLSSYKHKPDEAMLRITQAMYEKTDGGYTGELFRYLIFTQAGKESGYGCDLAAFVLTHKLGNITETNEWHINPNSGNNLKVWVWTIDHTACKTWWREHGARSKSPKIPAVPVVSAQLNPPRPGDGNAYAAVSRTMGVGSAAPGPGPAQAGVSVTDNDCAAPF